MEQRQGHAGGIIPADAGSTILFRFSFLQFGDHPRGCGEHSLFVSSLLLN